MQRKDALLEPMFDANNVKWTGASQVNPEYEVVAMVKEMGSPRCRATCSTCAHLSLLCLRYLVAGGYELLSGFFFFFLFTFLGCLALALLMGGLILKHVERTHRGGPVKPPSVAGGPCQPQGCQLHRP